MILRAKALFPNTATVLSIEGPLLRLLVVKAGRITRWDSTTLTSSDTTNAEQYEVALAQGIARLKERGSGRVLTLVIAGNRARFRSTELPLLKRKLTQTAVQLEARREFLAEESDSDLHWHVVAKSNAAQQIFLVSVPKDVTAPVRGALRRAKVEAKRWELRPLTLARALGERRATLIDCQSTGTEILLVSGGIPQVVRSLHDPLGESAAERAARLSEQVRQMAVYYTSTHAEDPWESTTPIVVTGAGPQRAELLQALAAAAEAPVEEFSSPLEHASDFDAGAFAAAIGAALGSVEVGKAGPLQINIAPRMTPALPGGALAAGLAVCAGAVLLVPLGSASGHAEAQVTNKKLELATLQAEVRASNAKRAQLTQLKHDLDLAKSRVVSLEQQRNQIIATEGGAVSIRLLTAQERLPQGVTLSRFMESARTIAIDGRAPSYQAVFDYVSALQSAQVMGSVGVSSITAGGTDGEETRFTLTVNVPTTQPASTQATSPTAQNSGGTQ